MRLPPLSALLGALAVLGLTACGEETSACWDTTVVYDGALDRADQQIYATLDCGEAVGMQVIQLSAGSMDNLSGTCLYKDFGYPGRSYVCTAVAWLDRDGDEYEVCKWNADPTTCFPDPDDPQSEPQLVRLLDGGDPAWVPFTLLDP